MRAEEERERKSEVRMRIFGFARESEFLRGWKSSIEFLLGRQSIRFGVFVGIVYHLGRTFILKNRVLLKNSDRVW